MSDSKKLKLPGDSRFLQKVALNTKPGPITVEKDASVEMIAP